MENNVWQTMPLLDADLVQNRRVDQLRVYLPPRDESQHSNGSLDRAAVVLTGPNREYRYLSPRITTALAAHYDMHPRDFRVTTLHHSMGDLITIFPTSTQRDRAVDEGFFILANGTEIQLAKWFPALNMVSDPMPYRAKVKLHGVPLHNWSLHDINHLVSEIGHVECMAPTITNGNFDTLRVLLTCHDPAVPKNLLMTRDPHAIIVEVELEGFIDISDELPIDPPEHIPPPRCHREPPQRRYRESEISDYTSRSRYDYTPNYTRSRHTDFTEANYHRRHVPNQSWILKNKMETTLTTPTGEQPLKENIVSCAKKAHFHQIERVHLACRVSFSSSTLSFSRYGTGQAFNVKLDVIYVFNPTWALRQWETAGIQCFHTNNILLPQLQMGPKLIIISPQPKPILEQLHGPQLKLLNCIQLEAHVSDFNIP